jgi:tetratricopeptide (TPR) repeat protein
LGKKRGSAMRQVPADKYNVAWFKLAEFVARGEKERALGIYRLLVHSFNDRAFSYQLEGDLLWSFSDEVAVDKYLSAAQLYQKEGRLPEAIGVYELLVSIKPENERFIQTLFQLYQETNNKERLLATADMLSEILLEKNDFISALSILKRCTMMASPHETAYLFEQYALAIAKNSNATKADVHRALEDVVRHVLEHEATPQLNRFLTNLEAISKDYYQHACLLLKK